jgi:hypothetical protein
MASGLTSMIASGPRFIGQPEAVYAEMGGFFIGEDM